MDAWEVFIALHLLVYMKIGFCWCPISSSDWVLSLFLYVCNHLKCLIWVTLISYICIMQIIQEQWARWGCDETVYLTPVISTMCIKTISVWKLVLAQNVTKIKETFTFVSQFVCFLAVIFLWKFVHKARKGWCIFINTYRYNLGRHFWPIPSLLTAALHAQQVFA